MKGMRGERTCWKTDSYVVHFDFWFFGFVLVSLIVGSQGGGVVPLLHQQGY